MTSPDTSAVAPVPDPPGDFGVTSVWTSPSTYMALATFFLPLATLIFHKDVSGEAQALANAAAGIAVVALIVGRTLHKNTVVNANAQLAMQRLHQSHERSMEHLRTEQHLRVVSHQTAAQQKQGTPTEPENPPAPPEKPSLLVPQAITPAKPLRTRTARRIVKGDGDDNVVY